MSTEQNYNNAPILMCKRINLKLNAEWASACRRVDTLAEQHSRMQKKCNKNRKINKRNINQLTVCLLSARVASNFNEWMRLLVWVCEWLRC